MKYVTTQKLNTQKRNVILVMEAVESRSTGIKESYNRI